MLLSILVSVDILNIYRIESRLLEGLLCLIGGGQKLAIQINLITEDLIVSAIASELDILIGIFLKGTFKKCAAYLCGYCIMVTRTVGNNDIIISVIQLDRLILQLVCCVNSYQGEVRHLIDCNVRKSVVFNSGNASNVKVLRSYLSDLYAVNRNLFQISTVICLGEGNLRCFLIYVDSIDGHTVL